MAQIENTKCLCCGHEMGQKLQQLPRMTVTMVTCKNPACIMHEQTLTTDSNNPEHVDFCRQGLVKAG